MLKIPPSLLATFFGTILIFFCCLTSSSFGSLIPQAQEHFVILDNVHVMDAYGDTDQLMDHVPSIQLLANTKYKVTITSENPVFILVSRKSKLPSINTWLRFKDPYTYPDTKEFSIDSADLKEYSTQILLTVWRGPVYVEKKGKSTAVPATYIKNKKKFSLPYTLDYDWSGDVVKLTISHEK